MTGVREIKFRAWVVREPKTIEDEYLTRMIYGVEELDDHDTGSAYLYNLWSFAEAVELSRRNPPKIILMQYTGLKDKNGKEIYEGDIIRTSNDKWWNNTPDKEIVFSGNGFWLTDNGGQHYLPDETVREVIGNIYESPGLLGETPENPELLEKNK